MHSEQLLLQCEMDLGDRSLFVLLPFFDDSDEEGAPFVLSLLSELDIPAPFAYLDQPLLGIVTFPSILPSLFLSQGRLPQEIALAWALRLPSFINASPQTALCTHRLILDLSSEDPNRIPLETLSNYCTLFIDRLKELSLYDVEMTSLQASRYLFFAAEEQRFVLTEACIAVLSSNPEILSKLGPESMGVFFEVLSSGKDIHQWKKCDWSALCLCLDGLSDKRSSKAMTSVKTLAEKMTHLSETSLIEEPMIASCSMKTLAFLLRKGRLEYIEAAQGVLSHVHEQRLNHLDLDPSVDVMAYCHFLEKTIIEYKIVDGEKEIPLTALCRSIQLFGRENPARAKALMDCLLKSIVRICRSKNHGKYPLELAVFALKLLRRPIDKEFQTHQLASQLLISAFESSPEGVEFFDFFKVCVQFFKMDLSEEAPLSLRFNLYQKETRFQGPISDFVDLVLGKALAVSARICKEGGAQEIDGIAYLAMIAYHLCPDYCTGSKCRTGKNFVMEVVKCLLSCNDVSIGEKGVSKILGALIHSSLLKEEFIRDLSAKKAEIRNTSIAHSYIDIFMKNVPSSDISWAMVLVLIKGIRISGWSSEELGVFTRIYAHFLDRQYTLHAKDTTRTEYLRPLTDLYLQLIESSPKMYLAVNLLVDVALNRLDYTPPERIEILKRVASRISLLSYSEEDISLKKVDSLISLYTNVYEDLKLKEKKGFARTLAQIAPPMMKS